MIVSEAVISLFGHCKSECVAHLSPLLPSTKTTLEFAVQLVESY